jgi:hypothetical protein
MRSVTIIALGAILAACTPSTPAASPTTAGSSASATATVATATASEAASVVCEFYAPGGPNDDISEAFKAVLDEDNPAAPMRSAIDKLKALAERASGEEQHDLANLADKLDEMALGGHPEDMLDVTDPFYVKYADQCGAEVAN